MRVRELPPVEWGRLRETELGPIIDAMPLEHTMVLVVEDDAGEIVGCWGCYSILHVEGIWIREDHRKKGSVGRRLWTAMRCRLEVVLVMHLVACKRLTNGRCRPSR